MQTIKDQMANRPLLNETMSDGSRLFLQLPQTYPPSSLLRQIVRLGGIPTAFVSDEYSGLNLNQDKATKPQTVQIVRQGEATPYWFKVNPL